MKLRNITGSIRRARDYIRHDLREIIAPSSLPNPPGYIADPPLTWSEKLRRVQHACSGYIDSWNSEKVDEALKKRGQLDDELNKDKQGDANAPTLLEDFAAAAKGGSKAMKPYLQQLYQTRLRAYRNAVQYFIEGYKEGFQEASTAEWSPINDDDKEPDTVTTSHPTDKEENDSRDKTKST